MDPTALPLYHIPTNYQDWRTKMREYLLKEGSWYNIIKFFSDQPNHDDYKTWKDKNAKALHAIQDACGPNMPVQILALTSAKHAWETLAKLITFKQREITPGDPRSINPLLDVNAGYYISETTNPPTWIPQPNLNTWLLSYEPPKDFTPLVSAIKEGDWNTVSAFISKDGKILTSIISSDGSTPIHEAATAHQTEMAQRLVQKMSEEDLEIQSSNGHTPLHDVAHVGSTPIARLLVQKNKKLVQIPSAIGSIPVALASASGNKDTTRYLYHCTPIELLYPESGMSGFVLLQYCITNRMLGFKKIYEMKLTHIYAMECINCIFKEIPTTDLSQFSDNVLSLTLVSAVENGIEEFVAKIVEAHPASLMSVDNKGRNLMMLAVASRQEKIFKLMLKYERYGKANITDYKYNNTLHWAGMPPPPQQLARISGAALQMQRELQWFKEVESKVQPSFWDYPNSDGDTPREVFTKNHEQLRKDGEQWMKETATSCTVVCALLITMMFAAAFTVPGGNSDDGLPLFRRKKAFITFIISDAISLFSSSTSVLMFLGILTSRYAEDDFLESLPKKMIIGLSTLFLSIAAMMVAFCASIIIMLHGRLSVIVPVCLLAGIPVSLFVILQFPLLVEIFISTYFGIFSMKKKPNYKIE
ncbi:hypothetical protein Tsubulata_029903 [Turnera subulata]|uniref:PGG domain-containing protein n=1 Tax=Turnera subulata TaxID=218843 RepID=A0A9Q0FV48_9ROSI|nr:hypothetical protein Tsubulata_029903 [Turnera subulata]